ncbi:hypothetical protein, partial [Limosilactobacillus fermentum]|uniref:hypothetical protein n=1 Tax=Limosilactobacillus fermentum TaxID=1613 RepID=UPI00316576F0
MKALWFIDTPILITPENAVNTHFGNFRKRISQNPYQACFHLGDELSNQAQLCPEENFKWTLPA